MRCLWLIVLIASTAAADAPAPEPKQKTGACAGRTFKECISKAVDYEYGVNGVKRDRKKAAAMFRAACDANIATACTSFAERGTDAGLTEAEIRTFFEKGCSLGTANDCALYAHHLADSDDRADVAQAFAMFAKLCDDGDGGYCNKVADHQNDRAEIAKWRRKACAANVGSDCTKLARLLWLDEDPALTPTQSTRALEQLCTQGEASACMFVGQRHFEGKGVKKSRAESDKWDARACELGAADMCRALGRRALFDDKKPDKARASMWFQKACDAGDADSCEMAKRALR